MALLASMVPNTSTASGAVYTPPVGQQTTSPTNNVKASANTTPTPAPIDLSSSYGKSSNGTIYKLAANGQPAPRYIPVIKTLRINKNNNHR